MAIKIIKHVTKLTIQNNFDNKLKLSISKKVISYECEYPVCNTYQT